MGRIGGEVVVGAWGIAKEGDVGIDASMGDCSRDGTREERSVRSSVSIGGDEDLRRRGEVRRDVRAALGRESDFFVSLVCEKVDEKDVFDVMDRRAGRVLVWSNVRREVVG